MERLAGISATPRPTGTRPSPSGAAMKSGRSSEIPTSAKLHNPFAVHRMKSANLSTEGGEVADFRSGASAVNGAAPLLKVGWPRSSLMGSAVGSAAGGCPSVVEARTCSGVASISGISAASCTGRAGCTGTAGSGRTAGGGSGGAKRKKKRATKPAKPMTDEERQGSRYGYFSKRVPRSEGKASTGLASRLPMSGPTTKPTAYTRLIEAKTCGR
mmetsp:Transcript_13510/g.22471  ORF Transcript_13510/g.22471 Transcript_13510/m.22471 type:complete len:214 (+) Transcript_13510:150-791(+)